MLLENKVAIITGGASGIGFGTAKVFLEEGAKVAIFDINKERVMEAAQKLSQLGEIKGYAVDITNLADDTSAVNQVVADFGTVDILVNNAGITSDRTIAKMSEEEFDRVIDINLKGTFRMTKAVLPVMTEKNYGKIVSASSIAPIAGNFGQSNYSASKAAIIGMTRSMARELGKYNINVNALAPGFVMTEMTAKIPEDIKQQKIARIPLKRAAYPEDIGNIYAFLCSDKASFITGTCIIADGGMHGC